MAMAPKLMALLMLVALVAAFAITTTEAPGKKGRYYGEGSLKPAQCKRQCNRRCSRTQYLNNCLLFCNKCCKKCLCVPPGYYGNKQKCAFHNNWKTQEGGPKCP